jgi:hypothetical protein
VAVAHPDGRPSQRESNGPLPPLLPSHATVAQRIALYYGRCEDRARRAAGIGAGGSSIEGDRGGGGSGSGGGGVPRRASRSDRLHAAPLSCCDGPLFGCEASQVGLGLGGGCMTAPIDMPLDEEGDAVWHILLDALGADVVVLGARSPPFLLLLPEAHTHERVMTWRMRSASRHR